MPHIVASLTCLASAAAAFYVPTCRALPLHQSIRSANSIQDNLNTSLLASSSSNDVDDPPSVRPSRFATGAWVATA